ncbi:hypothetical protein PAMP_019806 [Pampus punctatissimus]
MFRVVRHSGGGNCELDRKTLHRKPVLESIPDVHPQKEELKGDSPGQKHKTALTIRLLCNPTHPNNRAIMHQKFGVSLPDVHKRSTNAVKHQRVITGPTVTFHTIEPKSRHSLALPEDDTETGMGGFKSRCHKQLKWETDPGPTHEGTDRECTPPWTTKTPPPSTTSKSMDYKGMMQGGNSLISQSSPNLPVQVVVNISKFPFTIIKGQINPMATDFCHFKQSFSLCWSSVVDALETLQKLLRDFAVPVAKVSGERLAEFGHCWNNGWRRAPPLIGLLSVLENREEVLDLVLRPGQRYKGEGGVEAAAIHIQSCWRRYLARTAYLSHYRRKWAAGTIAISWLMHTQMRRVRKALQARRFRQLENYRSRAQTHNMCLSTILKYSPRTLKRIKNLIQGKQAYIIGGVAHEDDLAVADELGVPILGSEPAIAQLYSTKSGGKRIFTGAEVDVPPGQGDVYSLNQLHETLAELMTQNIDVQRWLFKMDSEHGGRGTAYCDICHLSCYNWALQEYHRYGPKLWNTKYIQESVLLRYLDEIPEWLARYARPAKTSCYPNWACFLKTFLRQGGVVEAFPPSDSVTCLTVDLLLEPGGEVTMLSCGDQLHGSCQLEAIGSSVPQTSVCPETLRSICMRVGQACLQRLIVGYITVDLATFLNHSTKEQKVWAIDLDLTYSDQLAMTQMLLMMTGGSLNCSTGCLEVPVPVREKSYQIAAKPPVVNHYAVIGSHLFHSNLSMLYHNVFFRMCKAHGIGFNMKSKRGTVFALYDSSERCSIGMMLSWFKTNILPGEIKRKKL